MASKIQVPGARGSLGVKRAVRGSSSTIDIQTKAAGGRALGNLGGAIVGLLAQAAQAQAASRAQTQIAAFQKEKADEINNASTAEEAMNLMLEAQAGWAGKYAEIAQDEGKNLLFKDDYNKTMLGSFQRTSIDFDDRIAKAATAKSNFLYSQALRGAELAATENAANLPGPYEEDSNIDKAREMIEKHRFARGEASTAKDHATLDEVVKGLREASFAADLDRAAVELGPEGAIAWGRETGRSNSYGLKEEETDQLLNIFKQKAKDFKAKTDAKKEVERVAVRAKHSEAIYSPGGGGLKYEDVFNEESPLTDAEKRSTWKEGQNQLDRIANGVVRNRPIEDQMSKLYGNYLRNSSQENRDVAYDYYQRNSNQLSDTQANYTRKGLLEDNPTASDKQQMSTQSVDMIDAMERHQLRVASQGLEPGEALNTAEFWEITDETIRDKNELYRWEAEARERNVALTGEDYRLKTLALLRPKQERITLDAIEQLTDFSFFKPFNFKVGQKRIEALKNERVWERLTSKEKIAVAEELRLGTTTVDEVARAAMDRPVDLNLMGIRQGTAPLSQQEFESNVGMLKASSDAAARAYYDRWAARWQ